MIIIKDKTEKMVSMVRNTSYNNGTFSIVLQNTSSKKITIFTTEDIGNELYMKFKLNLSNLDNGEYYMLIFENPDSISFYTNMNNPKEVTYFLYVANNDNLIMNGTFYLVMPTNAKQEITYIQAELLRIGEYKNNSKQYNKEQGYVTYNG